jgi:hypothetical protein
LWWGSDLGPDGGPRIPWERNCFNKLLCLANSPFDETALLDADLLWTAHALDIWDGITADVAGVDCPQYRTRESDIPGICACITLSRDREAIRRVMALRNDLQRPNHDEDAYDLAEKRGLITRQRLPPEWAFDGRAMLGIGQAGPFHRWRDPACWPEKYPLAGWSVDGVPIRSFHLSGIKERALRDPRLMTYLKTCAAIVRR